MGSSLTEHSQETEDWVYDTVGGLGQKVKENLEATVRAKVTQKLPQGRQQDLVVTQTCQDMKLSFFKVHVQHGEVLETTEEGIVWSIIILSTNLTVINV